MANIEFKGFKLIHANGNSIDQVLKSYSGATHDGILYLVRTHDTGKDGYLVLNGKVYGSALEAKALIADLNATVSASSTTKFINAKIVEENGKLKSFTIDDSILGNVLQQFGALISEISGSTIDNKINTAIDGLDATVSAPDTKYISGTIVEEIGKLTSFTIDDTKLVTKIDQIDGAITAITGDTGTINTKITNAINALDASVTGTSTDSRVTVKIDQVNGKLTGVTVTDTLGTASKKNVAEGTLSLPTGETSSTKDGLTTAAQVENFVKESISDLAGAMHFEGVVTGDTLPDTSGYTKGDVILKGTKEFVHDGSKWVELGDEGIYLTTATAEADYVKKTTTIAGVDLQNDITKDELRTALSIANVADGAQVNVLEGVKVNGTDLNITDKKVNITVTSGTTNGTISVNGANVAVTGLKSAAYESVDAFDASGTATTEIAKISGETTGTASPNYGITVTTTQKDGKVTGITVDDSALKTAITGITKDITDLSNAAVKNVNGKTGIEITLTGKDITVGEDVDGDGTMTANSKVSEVLADIYTKLNTANANAYTGITAADNTVTVSGTTHGHSVAVKLKTLSDPEKASGLIQLVSDAEGIYGKLFYDGVEEEMGAPVN